MSETTSAITAAASSNAASNRAAANRAASNRAASNRAASNHAAGDSSPSTAEADALPLLTDYLDDVAARMELRLGDVAGVGITLRVDGAPFTAGASSALAREVDLIQYRIGRGPCLDALQHGFGHYVPDLADDSRWGSYGPSAAARGAASCLSVPVLVREQPAAVLKVYSWAARRPDRRAAGERTGIRSGDRRGRRPRPTPGPAGSTAGRPGGRYDHPSGDRHGHRHFDAATGQ